MTVEDIDEAVMRFLARLDAVLPEDLWQQLWPRLRDPAVFDTSPAHGEPPRSANLPAAVVTLFTAFESIQPVNGDARLAWDAVRDSSRPGCLTIGYEASHTEIFVVPGRDTIYLADADEEEAEETYASVLHYLLALDYLLSNDLP
jgi:hypothetical protein